MEKPGFYIKNMRPLVIYILTPPGGKNHRLNESAEEEYKTRLLRGPIWEEQFFKADPDRGLIHSNPVKVQGLRDVRQAIAK